MLRSWGWRALLACAWFALIPGRAQAAEIAWRAPAECQRADIATGQVEKLVGRSLASVDAITFEVEIEVDQDATHRVLLRTLAKGSAPRERTIAGASCAEVTDAVSVAIALTISEQERERSTASGTATPAETATSSQSTVAPLPTPEPDASSAELQLAVGLGLLMDAGALPNPAPGFDLAAALELKALRVGAFVAVFLPQDTELPDQMGGGTFDFVLAGVDLCAHPVLDALHLLACAGFEVGRIGALGKGVRNGRPNDAGWYAPRVELGVGYGIAKIARAWLRGGIAVPLARPKFVLDETDRVHQPSSTAFRAVLAIELLL